MTKINIKRVRYAITRNNKEILCGLARHYFFTDIEKINSGESNSALKTYTTEKKAITSFMSSWGQEIDGKFYKVIEVIERLYES